MRILCIGDVFGRPGRDALKATLPRVRREHRVDLVIANGENSAHGAGITITSARDLFDAGVDVITGGNHTWHRREARAYLEQETRVIRPLNYPRGTPGRGAVTVQVGDTPVLVLNALGRLFMKPMEDPFQALNGVLEGSHGVKVIVVDFHAEATSEKRAMGFFLDGKVSLMVGTHTHVPTADAQILPRGAAYVTDLGMVGARYSVIGLEVPNAVAGFTTGLPSFAQPALGPVEVNAVLVDVDPASGKATAITRLDYPVD
ncbi:MAG TPA: TIGR00282 family metallophosphoesterase [Chloroflexota bacterium]|nr:TIGR00282 family metallophosphoesterase [Chloroflexota bacterium]